MYAYQGGKGVDGVGRRMKKKKIGHLKDTGAQID